MTVAIIGGVKSIERQYKETISEYNYKCKIFNENCPLFDKKIENVDACILFTKTVSHKMAKECCKICKKNNITLIKANASGITCLKESMEEISANN